MKKTTTAKKNSPTAEVIKEPITITKCVCCGKSIVNDAKKTHQMVWMSRDMIKTGLGVKYFPTKGYKYFTFKIVGKKQVFPVCSGCDAVATKKLGARKKAAETRKEAVTPTNRRKVVK